MVCGGRARGRVPLGGAARVPWGLGADPRARPGSGAERHGGAGRRGPVGCDGPGEVRPLKSEMVHFDPRTHA